MEVEVEGLGVGKDFKLYPGGLARQAAYDLAIQAHRDGLNVRVTGELSSVNGRIELLELLERLDGLEVISDERRKDAPRNAYVHELTDDGWEWCRAVLSAPRPEGSTYVGGVLYSILSGLGTYLAIRSLGPRCKSLTWEYSFPSGVTTGATAHASPDRDTN